MQLIKHGKRMSILVGLVDEIDELLSNASDSVKQFMSEHSGDLSDKEEHGLNKLKQHYEQLLKENENSK